MSIRYVCDRCGIDLKIDVPLKNIRFDIHTAFDFSDGIERDKAMVYDICDNCRKDFWKWIKKEDREENEEDKTNL